MTALNPNGTTAAVIVTHRRVDLLKHSLEQVVNQTHPVDWVIVVDNGAQHEVQELLGDLAADRAVYLPSHTNPVSYTHLTLPTIAAECRSRWSPDH